MWLELLPFAAARQANASSDILIDDRGDSSADGFESNNHKLY